MFRPPWYQGPLHRLDDHRPGLDGGIYDTGIVAGAEFQSGRYRVYLAAEEAIELRN